jgi:hypothetical protein
MVEKEETGNIKKNKYMGLKYQGYTEGWLHDRSGKEMEAPVGWKFGWVIRQFSTSPCGIALPCQCAVIILKS